jgi:subtilase family serine protease
MKLGFNTSGNNQTNGRITQSVLMGKLRNTIASTSRKFKYCNSNSPDLNVTFDCVFNELYQPNNQWFEPYHILNGEEIPLDIIESEQNQENDDSVIPLTKSILRGPFNPSQIRTVYSVPTILPSPGIRRPIVTIISAFNNPYLINDVRTFGRVFGLPTCNITVHNFSRRFVTGWAIETTLNVQWVYAINPYAQIRVIQAASNSWNDIFNAINFANNRNNFNPRIDTDIITMSIGVPDNEGLSSLNNRFNNPNTIYLAASGNSNNVSFPSSCTNVIAVGGTSLNLNSNLTRVIESVWPKSGCGFSRSFTRPSYQPSLQPNNLRATPDVSCVADPNTGCIVVLNGRGYSIGGTSLASPLYAGMLSLVTQRRLNNRKSTYTSVSNKVNSIQPLLYNNGSSFFDVTQGSSGPYVAKPGFDNASGLGVLICNDLVNILS